MQNLNGQQEYRPDQTQNNGDKGHHFNDIVLRIKIPDWNE